MRQLASPQCEDLVDVARRRRRATEARSFAPCALEASADALAEHVALEFGVMRRTA
jgi:hypothetical protein